jgi:hypothetical protein
VAELLDAMADEGICREGSAVGRPQILVQTQYASVFMACQADLRAPESSIWHKHGSFALQLADPKILVQTKQASVFRAFAESTEV